GAVGGLGADHRGERDGEGTGGADDAPTEPASVEALCGGELRGDTGDADGERGLRAREGGVHGGGGPAGGVLRVGGRGDVAAGRDRGDADRDAGQAAAGIGGRAGAAAGEQVGDFGGRAGAGGDQQGAGGG